MSAATLWKIARTAGLSDLGRRAASHWPFPVKVSVVGGRQMYVDLRSTIGQGLFATGTFDIEAIKPALDALEPGATFIDIGANVGFYSILALDKVGPSGKVYCFEIDPRPIGVLKKTIGTFGLANVHLTEAAVSDTDGILTFVPMSEHGHNRIDRGASAGRSVRSVRLDTWMKENGVTRVDVIKVDVEGAEKFVLDGASETIARFKPLLLLEAADDTAASFGYTPRDLIEQLQGLGYATTWLNGVNTPTLVAMASAAKQ